MTTLQKNIRPRLYTAPKKRVLIATLSTILTHASIKCAAYAIDEWMDDLRFYVLFNSISVISGRCLDDNERLCAMELRLRLSRFRLE